ncbi:MAG: thioredoxin family protein [Deltaproteobacteria bacterium]|nr:thioredoxin family protein [Deltaproteobacteria bacterium]
MSERLKSLLTIGIIIGIFLLLSTLFKGPSEQDFEKAGITILKEANQSELLSNTNIPTMILFNTNTCSVCKIFAPKFIDFAKKNRDKARFFVATPTNVNFDEFKVWAYPTTRIYYKGEILEELVGNGSLYKFQRIIDNIK